MWKGFEYRPETLTTETAPGETRNVELTLTQPLHMPELGYWSGDPHIHIPRVDDADERVIFDLMRAEDIHFGTLLAYNEPAGPYFGFMDRMDSPQRRGLGQRSVLSRGASTIVSGQEYRSSTYGHLNLFMLDELLYKRQEFNADNWPPYGHIGRAARELGGYAIYAHGGYAQEVYADMVQGHVDGVELLQFGVYRGIGLVDWYRMLNTGFRFPAIGASDGVTDFCAVNRGRCCTLCCHIITWLETPLFQSRQPFTTSLPDRCPSFASVRSSAGT